MKQSSKTSTVKVTTPTSKMPITEIKQITEDASAWPTVNVAKQKNGLAYCDGSTLTNTGGIYDDFNTANGSLVLPNGPFRTKEIDLTFSSTPAGWSLNYAKGVAYSDVSGQWRLKFNISADASTSPNISATVSGVTFFGSAVEDQAITVIRNLAGGPSRAFADATTGGLVAVHDSASDTSFKLSGDVALASAPTWAAANLESYPVIALQDNAGANVLGIPKNKWQTKELTSDVTASSGTLTDLTFSGLSIGKIYKVSLQASFADGTSGGQVFIDIMNDGVIQGRALYNSNSSDEAGLVQFSIVVIFEATASTATFDYSNAASTIIRGNNTKAETYARIEELDNYDTETTDFT